MQEDKVLVSESENKFFLIFGVVIFIAASLFFYSQMLVQASWIGCVISLIFLGISIFLLSNCFVKIYYFSDKNIVIADHKDEYIDEIECNNSLVWNEFIETRKWKKYYRITIENHEKKIILEKEDYKNYDEIVSFCVKNRFKKDTNLSDYSPKGIKEISSKLDGKIAITSILTGLGLLLSFWIITSFKNDTNRVQYYSGEITLMKFTTGKYRRINGVLISLKNYPSFKFRLDNKSDIDYFQKENEHYYKPKKIKIGISKDDYDWKTKNEFIKFLNFSDGTTWDVQEYQMLDK